MGKLSEVGGLQCLLLDIQLGQEAVFFPIHVIA
jgi:hypothetical protein